MVDCLAILLLGHHQKTEYLKQCGYICPEYAVFKVFLDFCCSLSDSLVDVIVPHVALAIVGPVVASGAPWVSALDDKDLIVDLDRSEHSLGVVARDAIGPFVLVVTSTVGVRPRVPLARSHLQQLAPQLLVRQFQQV